MAKQLEQTPVALFQHPFLDGLCPLPLRRPPMASVGGHRIQWSVSSLGLLHLIAPPEIEFGCPIVGHPWNPLEIYGLCGRKIDIVLNYRRNGNFLVNPGITKVFSVKAIDIASPQRSRWWGISKNTRRYSPHPCFLGMPINIRYIFPIRNLFITGIYSHKESILKLIL